MHDTPLLHALVVLTFLLAGLVKGLIGLGLPTVAIGLLSLLMAPAQAAALLVVPSLVTNVWQLAAGPRFLGLARRLWTMMLAIGLGTWAGAGILTGSRTGVTMVALGCALVAYAVLGLAAVRLSVPARIEPWLSPIIGAATGLVTGATGVFVIPAVPYLQALGLDKDELVQALGLSFTVSTVALAGALARGGALDVSMSSTVLALAPALLGMVVGQYARSRIEPRIFRLCFFWGLLALGAHLILQGLL